MMKRQDATHFNQVPTPYNTVPQQYNTTKPQYNTAHSIALHIRIRYLSTMHRKKIKMAIEVEDRVEEDLEEEED